MQFFTFCRAMVLSVVALTALIVGFVVEGSVPVAAATPVGVTACTPSAGYNSCLSYAYTGVDRSLIVPKGVTAILITAKGAGGGKGSYAEAGGTGLGGSGGLASGTLTTINASRIYTVRVGQAGRDGVTGLVGSTSVGGGGAGGQGSRSSGGGGGGYTAVLDGAVPVIVAGGGGGGSGASGAATGGVGGAGGGATGAKGGSPNTGFVPPAGVGGGGGGTQTAGGAAGTTNPSLDSGGNPTAGARWFGGTGGTSVRDGGGGGGGGYYGGGGGAGQTGSNKVNSDAGGGGGSSFISGLTEGSTISGGGALQRMNGEVTFQWNAPKPVILSPTAGEIIDTSTPMISGTAGERNAVTVAEGATTLCTVMADATGAWSCTVPEAYAKGTSHAVIATQHDSAPDDLTSYPASDARSFSVDWSTPQAAAPTTLPSTGGLSTDDMLLAGLALLMVAVGAALIWHDHAAGRGRRRARTRYRRHSGAITRR